MHISLSALVLGTVAAGTVNAGTTHHSLHHGKRHNHAIRHAEIMERAAAEVAEPEKRDGFAAGLAGLAGTLLSTAGASRLSQIGALQGANAVAPSSDPTVPWVGTSGNANYTNEFVNQSGEDLILTIWGPQGSWVNTVKPQITTSIPAGQNQTISFPNGWSGAWAPVYGQTKMYFGQVLETWGEGTFNEYYSTVDVSREVNMVGRNMKIVTPNCYSDMATCVFKCGGATYQDSGVPQCKDGYKLENCAPGSQVGANHGQDPRYGGADSGGCSGMGKQAKLTTYLGYQ